MSWRVRRVQELAQLVNGFPFGSDDFSDAGDLPLVRIRDVLAESFETYISTAVVPQTALVRDGDVVIGMDGDFNLVHWSRGRAALNQRLCLLRDNGEADAKFLAYALPPHLKKLNDLTYATTVKHLSSAQIRAIRLSVPERQTQRVIADYLDRETARIDSLIEEQQCLIELLSERQSAVIAEAITKGTRQEVDLVSSGVEWIGDVPRTWSVKALGRCGTLVTGSTPPTGDRDNFSEEENERPWVRPQDLSSTTTASSWLTPQGWSRLRSVPAGSVLVGCIAYSLGSIGYSSVTATTNQQITSLVPTEVNGRYLYYVLRAAKNELWAASQINRVPILNNQRLGAIKVPVPPVDDARIIADYLDEQMAKIERTKNETKRLIDLARERRAAVIAAAVNGQVDVWEMK